MSAAPILSENQFQVPVEGNRVRVACVAGGLVVSIQIVDSARLSETAKLFDRVYVLEADRFVNEGYLATDDGVFSAPVVVDATDASTP